MAQADRNAPAQDLTPIYQKLKVGQGHELVNDDNVFALIAMAERYGDKLIEATLREWQAPCSDGSNGVPSTIAPTRGFNRENAKR